MKVKHTLVGLSLACLMHTPAMASAKTTTMTLEPGPVIVQKAKPHFHKHGKKWRRQHCQKKNKLAHMNFGLKNTKPYTIEQAKTIAEAGLLLKNHRNFRIGEVKAMPNQKKAPTYRMQVINKKGKVVRNVLFNARSAVIAPLKKKHKLS